MPLWAGAVAIGTMAVLEAGASLFYLRSVWLIFTCIVEGIQIVLLAANSDNSCYRKSVFFSYITTTSLKMPLLVLAFLTNSALSKDITASTCEGESK